MLHNDTYSGRRVLDAEQGPIAQEVPAIVSPELAERARSAVARNKANASLNAKHLYLLRGLMTCRECGWGFSGLARSRKRAEPTRYYRCTSQNGIRERRCSAKMLMASAVEDRLWEQCRAFILNPGPRLDEARARLRERLAESAERDGEGQILADALADKDAERQRVLGLYRRGKIEEGEADAELDAIAREAAELRARLDAIQNRDTIAREFETRLGSTLAALAALRQEIERIEREDDRPAKRRIFEQLVTGIEVETLLEGGRKRARLHPSLAFARPVVIDSPNPEHSTW